MNSASRWTRLVAVVALVALSALLAFVPAGCGPAPQAPEDSGAGQQVAQSAEPAIEEATEPPTTEPDPSTADEPAQPLPEEPEAEAPEPTTQPATEALEPAAEAVAKAPGASTPTTADIPEPAAEEVSEPAADDPVAAAIDPLKVSTYAPAKDLVSQLKEYLEEIQEPVASEDDYADFQSKLAKDANTLILIALALGLHDQDNPYKAAAPALIEATQHLAATTDYATAKAAVEAVEQAASSNSGSPSSLKWEKLASMSELMKAVPLIHSRLKRYLRGSRFKSRADTSAGLAAVLAVVAQGAMANAGDTEKPNEVEKWHAFCAEMRDAATSVHAAIRAQDEPAAKTAMERLQQSCDDCHAVFHPEELNQPLDEGEE